MKRALVIMLNSALCVGAIAGASVGASAQAQVRVVISPPAAFRAMGPPVYFEGRAAYWYGDRWYYRDRGAWQYYHDEPAYLRDYRGQHRHRYHFYENNRRRHRRGGR